MKRGARIYDPMNPPDFLKDIPLQKARPYDEIDEEYFLKALREGEEELRKEREQKEREKKQKQE